jgi:hypothetical protein
MTRFATITLAAILAATPFARAADAPKCADVVAAMELAGGGQSAEETAKKLDTTVEHVRKCWDEYDAARKAGTAK